MASIVLLIALERYDWDLIEDFLACTEQVLFHGGMACVIRCLERSVWEVTILLMGLKLATPSNFMCF